LAFQIQLAFDISHTVFHSNGTYEAKDLHPKRGAQVCLCPYDRLSGWHKGSVARSQLSDGDHDRAQEVIDSFELCGRSYVLPSDEVELLPIDNVTCEALSEEFLRLLLNRLGSTFLQRNVQAIECRVEETPGQWAIAHWPGE
jgi:hypothetical protein